MHLIEQKQGILIGVCLTIVLLYCFGFLSSPFLNQQVKDNEQTQERLKEAHLNRLLDEPMALNNINRKAKQKKEKEGGQEWGALKKMMKNSPVAVSAKVIDHPKPKEAADKDKKDANKEEEKNTNENDASQETAIAQDENNGSNNQQAANNNPTQFFGEFSTPTGAGSQMNEDNQNLETVSQWIDFLSHTPSWNKLQSFIRSYQNQEITAPMFYSVVEALIENVDSQVKNLGFLALNSTPSLESFQHLVRIATTNNETANQDRANKTLKDSYAQINNLPIIQSALGSTEDHARLKAAEISIDSANKNLKKQNTAVAAPGNNNSGRTQRQMFYGNQNQNNSPTSKYEALQNKLEDVAQRDHNPDVQMAADRAAQIINQLLLGQTTAL